VTLIIALFLLLVAFIMLNSSVHSQGTQPTVAQPATDSSQTPRPQETVAPSPTPGLRTNDPNEANGIIFGGVLMVMIVVVGTLSIIRKKTNSHQ
jgi:hypothetical protein